MNEEELLLEEDNEVLEGDPSELSSEGESSEEYDITDQEILDAFREVIYENRENIVEGDNILSESNSEADPVPSPSVIDYTQILTDIKNQQIQTNSTLTSIVEANEQTIFDKPISDYSITESILVFLVVFGFGVILIGLIKKFTPKLWR